MQKLLLGSAAFAVLIAAGSAMAADMPAKAPVYKAAPAVAAAYNWTGFYLGGHVGYGWARDQWQQYNAAGLAITETTTFNSKGALGGLQLGYNFQTGPWVWGIEGEYSWANLKGDRRDLPGTFLCNTGFACATNVRSVADVALRLGYAWNTTLLYLKVGGAWARETYSFPIVGGTGDLANVSDTRSGWLGGIGVEYGFTPNWSAKLEYDYIGMGAKHEIFAPGGFDIRIGQNIQAVKLGVNYRFN